MKVILRNIILISLLGFLVKCDEDEITSRDYPRLKTLPVSEITSGGVKFNAEITFRGGFEVINYGFVWGENDDPTLKRNDRVVFSENIQSASFSETIETTLKEETSYFVRAFVETDDFLVYGESISFISLGSKAPEILTISPLLGTVGDTLHMTGSNLSYLNNTNEIFFNDIKAPVFSSSDSLIYFVVPEIVDEINNVSISIAGNSSTYPSPFIATSPQIDSVFPQLVSFQDTIEINGDAFSYLKEANKVIIGNSQANVIMSSRTKLKVVVPSNLEATTNKLSLALGGQEVFFESISIKPPRIESINNPIITEYNNGHLIIKGENFNPLSEKNSVLLGNKSVAIVSSSKNELVVQFPRSIIPKVELSVLDTLDVVVTVLGQSSTLGEPLIVDYKSTWTKLRDFPGNPRIFGAYFSIGNKGYIGLGGGDEFDNWYKDFWEYDPNGDSWTRLDDFPGTARSKFASFVIGESAYIICGTQGNQYTESNNLSEVWEFNGTTRTWTRKNDFPGGARWSSFGFSIGDFGYAGGGVFGNYEAKTDFWMYDPKTDSWTQKNNIYGGVFGGVWNEDMLILSSSNTAYILGEDYGSGVGRRHLWEYDEINDSWVEQTHCPIGFREMSGFLINNKIYAGLGLFSNFAGSSVWLEYEINSDTWNYAEHAFPGGTKRTASSFSIGETGYVLLGKSGCHCANRNDVWKFDPSKPD